MSEDTCGATIEDKQSLNSSEAMYCLNVTSPPLWKVFCRLSVDKAVVDVPFDELLEVVSELVCEIFGGVGVRRTSRNRVVFGFVRSMVAGHVTLEVFLLVERTGGAVNDDDSVATVAVGAVFVGNWPNWLS